MQISLVSMKQHWLYLLFLCSLPVRSVSQQQHRTYDHQEGKSLKERFLDKVTPSQLQAFCGNGEFPSVVYLYNNFTDIGQMFTQQNHFLFPLHFPF